MNVSETNLSRILALDQPRLEREPAAQPPLPIRGPVGVALRVNHLSRMKCFYCDVLGFELAGEFPNAVLLEIIESNGRRAQTIGLFKRSAHVSPGRVTVGRITVSFSPRDYDSKKRRLEQFGIQWKAKAPGRIWIQDPEGNQVELVCHDF